MHLKALNVRFLVLCDITIWVSALIPYPLSLIPHSSSLITHPSSLIFHALSLVLNGRKLHFVQSNALKGWLFNKCGKSVDDELFDLLYLFKCTYIIKFDEILKLNALYPRKVFPLFYFEWKNETKIKVDNTGHNLKFLHGN